MSLPPGADKILSLRKKGHRPGENIVVSVVGELPVMWLVQPDLDTDYDWTWAIDLDVWVVANTKTDMDKLRRLLWAMRPHRPKTLYLWLDDRQTGYELFFIAKPATVHLTRNEWDWTLEQSRLLDFENQHMRRLFAGEAEFLAMPADNTEW